MPVVTKYQDTLADAATGRPVANVFVAVYDYPSGAGATRYNEAGTEVITDPIFTDSNGYFSFYVVPGHYQISISGNSVQRQLTDILVGPSPPGLPGPPGQGFAWSGEWKSDTVYTSYCVVFRNGNAYVAVQQSIGVDPGSDVAQTYWHLFVEGAAIGTASSQAEEDALVAAGFKWIFRADIYTGTTAPPTTPAPTTPVPTTPAPTTPAPTTPAPTTPAPTTAAPTTPAPTPPSSTVVFSNFSATPPSSTITFSNFS